MHRRCNSMSCSQILPLGIISRNLIHNVILLVLFFLAHLNTCNTANKIFRIIYAQPENVELIETPINVPSLLECYTQCLHQSDCRYFGHKRLAPGNQHSSPNCFLVKAFKSDYEKISDNSDKTSKILVFKPFDENFSENIKKNTADTTKDIQSTDAPKTTPHGKVTFSEAPKTIPQREVKVSEATLTTPHREVTLSEPHETTTHGEVTFSEPPEKIPYREVTFSETPITTPNREVTLSKRPETSPPVREVAFCEHEGDGHIKCDRLEKVINVSYAYYGRLTVDHCPCHSENAESIIKQRCNGKHLCSITPNNTALGGDPCPRVHKYVFVRYKCENKANEQDGSLGATSKYHEVAFCESNNSENITCAEEEQTINVTQAYYGRPSLDYCPKIDTRITNCLAQTSEAIIKEKCNGKNECLLTPSNQLFGDPCPGFSKFLFVRYQCEDSVNSAL